RRASRSQPPPLSHSSGQSIPCTKKKVAEFPWTLAFPEKALRHVAERLIHGLERPAREGKEIFAEYDKSVSRHIVPAQRAVMTWPEAKAENGRWSRMPGIMQENCIA